MKWGRINSIQKAAARGDISMIITISKAGFWHPKAVYGLGGTQRLELVDAVFCKTEQSAKIAANKMAAKLEKIVGGEK
jgi:hypothetical protein